MSLEPEFKFLIPLITDELKKEYFTEKAGFVGAYTIVEGEINQGLYSPCLWLVFDYDLNTKEKLNRFFDFKKIEKSKYGITKYKNLYDDPKHVIVNKKHYMIYGYPMKGTAMFIARDGKPYASLTKNDCRKILKFWGVDDKDAWNIMVNSSEYYNVKYPYKPLTETKKPKNQLEEFSKAFKQ